MRTVYFHNPGHLDIRGATTMGLSAKEDEDTAIGKFGTGLKYSIASILRWGGAVEIETGGRKFSFRTKQIDFRGKAHQQIEMVEYAAGGGHAITELGYTTHYGSTWQPWQVFRELYSNALDEGGGVYAQDSQFMAHPSHGQPFETIIRVHCPQVAECYHEKDTIILPSPGIEASHNLRYFNAPSNYLYYRGVRVRADKCLCTWNLLDGATLTEDRSVESTYSWDIAIAHFLQGYCNDADLIRKVLSASDNTYEGSNLSYTGWAETSQLFLDIGEELYRKHGRSKLPYGLWEVLCKHREHIDTPEEVTLTPIQQMQLDKAIELVERMGLPVGDYPIKVVALQKNILGQAKNGKVLLSPAVFHQGTKQVVSTLYEEVLHLQTGLKDCTYEMQTHLFNTIISLYEEHVLKEPI